MRRLLSALALATLSLAPLIARADDKEREADAERLFREAQKLLEDRRYAEACPKFQQAYEKDGKLGTLTNLAFCHKEQGANWYAWLEFREAEIKATELGRKDRKDFAHDQRVELEKSLPKVVLENPQKTPLLELRIDEHRVPEAERLAPFTAEPGPRKFTFRAKGKKPATVLIVVQRSDRPQRVPVPEMEDGSEEPTAPVVVEKPAPPPKKVEPPPPPPPPEPQTQRTIGYVAFGVAAVGVVAGTVTGALVVFSPCSDNLVHERSGCKAADEDRARSLGVVSLISYITAGVATALGVTLVATAPSKAGWTARPEVGVGWAGVRGSF